MASIANASGFLKSRAAADQAAGPNDPEHRLLAALERLGVVPLPDVPKLLGMTPEEAVPIVASLRARGRAEVIERGDIPGAKFLRLK